MITHWVGKVYKILSGEDYKDTMYHRFEKTDCLITADSSEHSKINPKGLDNCVVSQTLSTALAEQPQTCPVQEAQPNEEELSFEEKPLCMAYEESEVNKVYKNDEKNNWQWNRQNLQTSVKESENKDFIPTMAHWTNYLVQQTLDKYRIAFDDGTKDYMNLNSVDGIILL